MPIVCPYCHNPMSVKGAKPGRYTPRCAKCGKTFALTVPEDGNPLTAAPLAGNPKPAAPKPEAKPGSPPGPTPPPAKTAPKSGAEKKPTPRPRTPPAGHDLGPTLPGDAATADDAAFSFSPPAEGVEPDVTAADPSSLGGAPAEPHPITAALGQTLVEGRPEAPPAAEPSETASADVPATLGGYQTLKLLGRGGMGAVYLARQVSLDRRVALKVMNPQWAKNPAFMVRFTREAYAAAQLVHHNVVQVYDIGEERGIHFFSMEYVEGQSLQELIKKEGKLDCEMAAGYVLQAARGLKFAHDRGMIHRDVKPDNLLLNSEGIVKVADLGLVRTPGTADPAPEPGAAAPAASKAGSPPTLAGLSNITHAHQAMGTPAYMPPEQARDATRVDARADIYSLGCTLYVLVSGRVPFSGRTAMEVISRHAYEPVVPPEAVVQRVPKQLSSIVVKMMAKKPDDRYAHMGEVVKALEDFLGVQAAGKFSPREEHAQTLENCVKTFNEAPGAAVRNWFFPGFLGGCAVLFLLLTLLGRWYLAGGFLGLGVLTALAYFIFDGVVNRSHVFLKTREFLLESSWTDWLTWGGALLFLLVILWFVGLLAVWVGVVLIAIALAVGFHFLIDRPLTEQRKEPLEKVHKLLRELRLKGLDEDSLRQFVCKYSGERWEEFYEALFGYEAKLDARARWGKGLTGRPREKFGTWRDAILNAIDARRRARQEARERRHLQQLEQKNLEAQGLAADEARAKAERAADVMVQAAAQVKAEPQAPTVVPPEGVTVAADLEALARERANEEILRRRVAALLHAADEEKADAAPPRRPKASFSKGAEAFFDVFLGLRTRVLIGLVLLAGFLFWLNQHELMPGSNDEVNLSNLPGVWKMLQEKTGNFEVPFVPTTFTAPFASVNAGVAGLMLVFSIFFSGNRIGLFLIPAAAAMVFGPQFGVPEVGPLGAHLVSLAGGGTLAVLGFLFGRLPTM